MKKEYNSMLVDSKVLYRIEPFYFHDEYDGIRLQEGFRLYHFNKQLYYQYIQQLFFVENQNEKAIAKTYINDWNQVSHIKFENSLDNNVVTSFPDKKSVYRYYVNYEDNDEKKRRRCIYFKINNVQVIATMSHVGMVVYEFIIDHITEFQKINHESLQEVELELTPQNYEWAVYALRSIQHVSKKALELQVENKENKEQRAAYFKEQNFHLPEPENIPYLFKPFDWCELTNAIISKIFKEAYGFTEGQKPGRYALMYTGAIISEPNLGYKDDLANHLFKISRGYKHTYYKKVNYEGVIKPFDNVWWYFSDEGASSFVLEIKDDKAAMEFFESQYTSKWSTNYFYMYLLALIQKFSFIYFTIKTNERLENSILYKEGTYKIEELENELQETRKLYQTILKFQIQAYYEQISQHTHYNELYIQLLKGLRIPELVDELKQKLETFSQVIESITSEKLSYEKEKQGKDAKQIAEQKKEQLEKQNKVVQTITYFLLPATLTTGILGMNIPFIAESKDMLFFPVLFAVIIITAAMSLLINKLDRITSKFVLVVSSIIFLICLFLAMNAYNQKEQVEQKVSFEELCEKIDGCSYIKE